MWKSSGELPPSLENQSTERNWNYYWATCWVHPEKLSFFLNYNHRNETPLSRYHSDCIISEFSLKGNNDISISHCFSKHILKTTYIFCVLNCIFQGPSPTLLIKSLMSYGHLHADKLPRNFLIYITLRNHFHQLCRRIHT